MVLLPRRDYLAALSFTVEPTPQWNVAAAEIQRQEQNMSRGMPSMTALLGLLALAGYQNRDKIAELLRGADSTHPGASSEKGPLDGLLGGVAGGGIGGLLSGGLQELLERFKQN